MRVLFSWAADQNPCLSYGKAGGYIKRELERLCSVVSAPPADLQVYYGTPLWRHRAMWRRRCARFLWYTCCEYLQLPQGEIDRINAREGLVTPASFCDAVYEKRGVRVPRFIIPHGIDPSQYPFIERPKRKTFTVLWIGVNAGSINRIIESGGKPCGDRKRGWMVRQAFKELDLPDSRLILKYVPWPGPVVDITYPMGRATVHEVAKWLPEDEFTAMLASADVLCWPTWGEGFGLPPLEAGATGIPSILPNYSALTEYFDPAWCLELPYSYGRIWPSRRYYGARIAIEDVKAQLLWAYGHREDLREMGRAASEIIHRGWSWEAKAQEPLRDMLARAA